MEGQNKREGCVKVHEKYDNGVSLWVSCEIESKERLEMTNQAGQVLEIEEIPENTEIGNVTIKNGDVDFSPDDSIVDEYKR